MTQTQKPPVESSAAMRVAGRAAALALFGVVVFVLSELFTAAPSQAALPVVDMAAVGQMIQQYEQMTQQLQTMVQQVALLEDQIKSVTGHYGFGTLTGRVNPWGSSSWQDIIDMVGHGVNPGDAAEVDAYRQARSQYSETYPALSSNLLPQNPRLSAVYSGTYQSAMAGLGMGNATFDSIREHLAELQVYKDKIEQTDNVKAAIDLNTAVLVKVAQLNAEMLRTEAVQLHLQAGSENNLTSGQAAQVEFFAN